MNMQQKRAHKAIGLCVDCSRKATIGLRCDIHRESQRRRLITRRLRMIEEGRCTRCHSPMHEEVDEGKTHCIFCREGTSIYRKDRNATIY